MTLSLFSVTTAAQGKPNRAVIITTLGLTQIFAWGSTYYLPAVLAQPIATDTSWPLSLVVGGVSLGLLTAGLVSPHVGRTINRHGGRRVLSTSSFLLALGLACLGSAPSAPVYVAAWLLIGVGMGAGLYDAAFASLGRYYGVEARSAITTLTLWGGFASTVCWPLSAVLVEAIGWRGTCFVYAALQLVLALPAHLFLLPSIGEPSPHEASIAGASGSEASTPVVEEGRAFWLLAGVAVISGAVATTVGVHLLTLLQARDIALGVAVSLGALVGPSQVGARLVEMFFGRHYHPIWTMLSAVALIAAGLLLLAAGFPVLAVALVFYGAGNGIYSIGRGTLPLALFGPARYPVLMGRLARPGLIASALAPSVGAMVLDYGGAEWTFAMLACLAALNMVLVAALWVSIVAARGMTREQGH